MPNFQDVRFFNGTVKAGATDRIGWVSVFPSTILSGNWSIADPTDPGNRNKSTNIGGFGAGEPNVVGDRETAFRTNPDGSVTVTLAAGAAEAYTNLVIYNGAKGADYTVPLALDDLNTGNQVATSIASSGVLPTSSIDLATFFPQNGYFGASISIDGLQSGFAAEVPEPPGWALLGIASGLSALGGLLRRVRSLQERFHAAL